MERWRSYFGKAGADIWTIIEQGIVLAAVDHPAEFKEKRGEIAETLFARRLLQLQSEDTDATRLSGSVVTNATNFMEVNELRADEEEMGARAVAKIEGERRDCSYDEVEALTDEMEEETLLLKELHFIKETIAENDQSESAILDVLQRLEYMQINVDALKATEIGKQVNGLRRHSSKRVRAIVRRLVGHWKDLVDQWVKCAEDVTAAAVEAGGDIPEAGSEQGLASLPLDEGALLAARTASMEVSQLFSFVDDEICGQANNKEEELSNSLELSMKDNLYYNSSKSQSGSILTDGSDCNAMASTSRNWGFRAPEERGSTTRDLYYSGSAERYRDSTPRGSTSQCGNDQEVLNKVGGLSASKSVTSGSGPGRPSNDITKARVTAGTATGRSANDLLKTNRTQDIQKSVRLDPSSFEKSVKPSTLNRSTFTDKSQVAQRLEMSKRKLHEGYQQAENAKKQRTVQIVDLPECPKNAPMRGKVNPPVQSKGTSQSGQWNQNRRYG